MPTDTWTLKIPKRITSLKPVQETCKTLFKTQERSKRSGEERKEGRGRGGETYLNKSQSFFMTFSYIRLYHYHLNELFSNLSFIYQVRCVKELKNVKY